MAQKVPIGVSDFRQVREGGFAYVDKSELVRDVIRTSATVMLFPRPRRFGKTLNLSMLRYFFEKRDEDLSRLFAELSAFHASAADCLPHFQRYPVIFLSFKDVKELSFSACMEKVRMLLAEIARQHRPVLSGTIVEPEDRELLQRLAGAKASQTETENALRFLSRELSLAYGEQVVILIDEYDTPIQSGFLKGYYDEVVSFFRNFLSAGLKDNQHLFKGVLTGVLRVSKESLFSGLNNLAVYSLLRAEFSTRFGFTEEEVQSLAAELGKPAAMKDIRIWYNGYRFGGHEIYNPWSVLNFLDSVDGVFRPYWASTSSDDLLREMFLERGAGLGGELEALLHGHCVEKPVEEHVTLRELSMTPDSVWSLLLMSGYLKAEAQAGMSSDGITPIYRLSIPNLEVHGVYRVIMRGWLERSAGGEAHAKDLIQSLLAGDAEQFEALLEELIGRVLSYHDVGGREPERVFQAFILGLLTSLEPRAEVRSNRESGRGRYDVMVLPKKAGEPGVVLELKVVNKRRNETVEAALAAATQQLLDKDYARELRARGAAPIHQIAAVLDGKLVRAVKV
jgi:hypothetical protein